MIERKQKELGKEACSKQMDGSNLTQQHVPKGTQIESPLTNEGILGIRALLNIPTQQTPTTLPEHPTKKNHFQSEFTRPNCRMVEMGLHIILPVSS